jgi:uncharacterized protein (DUF58 family)
VRLRKRAGSLLLGAAVLFLIGTNMLGGILWPLVALGGLEAEVRAPDEAMQGGEALVEVVLRHPGRGVRWSLRVVDDHLEPTDVFVPSLGPGETIELVTVRSPARRGERASRAVEVRSAAPFGVAERRRRLPVNASTLVLPRVFPVGEVSFVEPVATSEAAHRSAPRRGHGPDYLGVREYRPGDPMRHVHWGLTARHGQVMVREFEEERTRRLAIVIDTERDAGETWTPFDRACAVAASLVAAAAEAGHGVRTIAAMDDGVEVLRRADAAEIQRWLARLEPTARDVVSVVRGLTSEDLRGVETVVVATPAWSGTRPEPFARALADLPVTRVVAVAVGLTGEEGPGADRDEWFDVLGRTGVDMRWWESDADLGDALTAVEVPT